MQVRLEMENKTLKKELVVKRLIDKLTEEKNRVNNSLVTSDYDGLARYQRHAFLTGKALRKILKIKESE